MGTEALNPNLTLQRVAYWRELLNRPTRPPDRIVQYGPLPDHIADIWDGGGPSILFLHGGSWRARHDRLHTRPFSDALAAQGYTVIVIEYRRVPSPGSGWPGTFDDVMLAISHLRPHVVAGHCSGGELALWAGGRTSLPVLALAPVCDLVESYRRGLGKHDVKELLGGSPEELPEIYAAANPPAGVHCVLIHGDEDLDVPVDMSRAYARASGPACNYIELPGMEHFGLIDPLSTAWPHELAALERLTRTEV